MAIRCPYCKFVMELKGTRPGRFSPPCQGCKRKFLLVISTDPDQPPTATALAPTAAPASATIPPKPLAKTSADSIHAIPVTTARPAPSELRTVMPTAAPAPAMPARTAAPAPMISAPPPPAAPAQLPDAELLDVERLGKLGGYEIIQRLGQGGMGAVYLARQVSLDRQVAVKVMDPRLARDAAFVARFTREAYAAAQLTHHNIVQIHDIGEEKDIHYFSMEFVPGHTLGAEIKAHGRLDADAAVGYVLQAARGLKFAHDQAMIHRDIKPENLLLNEQGLVKVADLGLVKRRGQSEITASPGLAGAMDASTTGAFLSMGTPAYMAPEQATDAAKVDARADIYSLGCTLYDLLTGRPPFVGKTVMEVITKHAQEKVVPPEMIVKDVPRALSVIVMKMTAKKPEDRYAAMGDVIRALEDYLGVSSGTGPYTPSEENAKALEISVGQFNDAPMAKLRRMLIPAYFGACAFFVVLFLYLASRGWESAATYIQWAGGIVGLAVLSFASYVVLTGITQRTHLFRKLRQYVFGARIADWARVILATAVLVGLLVLFNLQWYWLGFLIAAVGITAGFYFSVDLLLKKQRKMSLSQIEGMLKTMRLRGLDEDALRQFVCRYSGPRWEEFYEAMFGYEEKLQARKFWGGGARGQGRKKFAAWREPLIGWITDRIRQRQEDRERIYLAKVEERKLRALGVEHPKAKARKIATNVVAKAERIRTVMATAGPTALPGLTAAPAAKAASIFDDAALADEHVHRKHESYIQRKYGTIWGLVLGGQVRFLVGLGLLAAFSLWMYQNHPNLLKDLAHRGGQAVQLASDQASGNPNPVAPAPDTAVNNPPKPLSTDAVDQVLPQSTVAKILGIIGSYPGGLAGAILVISSLFSGARMGICIFISAAVILLGGRAFHIPTFGLIDPGHAGMIVGGALAALSLAFMRE